MGLDLNILITLGTVLAICLIIGLLAEKLHFPKVTAYLLVGLVAGPSVANWLKHDQLEEVHEITKLAMALVLFNLGCHFSLPHLRKILRRSLALSLGEILVTFVCVTVALLLFNQSWEMAIVLGALALATAPATTILVLKESSSDGPVTEHTTNLVAFNNLASIVVFEAVFIGIHVFKGKLGLPIYFELGMLARDIFGAIALGGLAGFTVTYGCSLLKQKHWLALLVAATIVVLGLCKALAIPYMLAFLSMGFVVVNASDGVGKIVDELDRLTGLLCVLFFAIHGAELDLNAFITAGAIGVVYIVGRTFGKVFGVAATARLIGEPASVQRWLGPSILAQAGAAIALSSIAVARDPELGKPIQTIILGSVVFFEIIGPFLIRLGVIRAGEVPLAQAIHHSSVKPISQIRIIFDRFLLAFGIDRKKEAASETLVSELMRKNVAGILESASFDEVIDYIEHSPDNTYPVLDLEKRIVGLICYNRMSSELFDPSLGKLVFASDLAVPSEGILYPDDDAATVLELFTLTSNDCIPVVSREPGEKFVGVVRRSDITNLLIRGRRKS